ncbi:MAG: hypothetical protein P8K08_27335 [Fuerstiella sp.]|jgi:hypothetical protein|nr:hypothetical protein [Fuerstiella sp.]
MMSHRIHLLTFSRCPASTCDGLDEFYGRMAAWSLVFENHYLQQPAAQCPFEALGGDESFAHLRAKASAGELSVRMVLAGDVRDEAARQLPAWLNVSATSGAGIVSVVDSVSEQLTQISTPLFLWVHVVLPADAGAEQIFEVVAKAEKIVSDSLDVLMITFLGGGAVCQPDRFQSLLFESDVRVPLWIQSSHPPIRVQTLTGSFDIAGTIADELEGTRRQHSASGPANLLRLAENPGRKSDRYLLIDAGEVAAVRTVDFLYVQTKGKQQGNAALYAKPEDVWNLNDVSGEYHKVVEELRELQVSEGA